jgi:hypothetical protein
LHSQSHGPGLPCGTSRCRVSGSTVVVSVVDSKEPIVSTTQFQAITVRFWVICGFTQLDAEYGSILLSQ